MSSRSIVILDGARRTPRADILINNREPGLFSHYAATALGGLAPVAYAKQVGKQRSGSPELREGSARRTLSPCPQPEGKANRLC